METLSSELVKVDLHCFLVLFMVHFGTGGEQGLEYWEGK